MTGIAKRLEKNGFIIRKNDTKDERVTLLEITPKGRRVLENIRAAHEKNMENYMRSFSDDTKNRLLGDLKRIFNKDVSV
jgi:MarR family transcriptional regulator, 2-MHQ and catechol-resistance regulon repressor